MNWLIFRLCCFSGHIQVEMIFFFHQIFFLSSFENVDIINCFELLISMTRRVRRERERKSVWNSCRSINGQIFRFLLFNCQIISYAIPPTLSKGTRKNNETEYKKNFPKSGEMNWIWMTENVHTWQMSIKLSSWKKQK